MSNSNAVAEVYDRRPTPTAVIDRRYSRIATLPARAASALVWLYQKTVSPALVVVNPTGGCRFAPTCSHYARGALAEHGLIIGAGLALRRLVKCGPWHPGGEDLVPQKDHKTTGPLDNQAARRPAPVCYSVRSP